MAYNYAKEKRKFDAEWKRKASWYRKEGMSEDNIEAIRRRRPLETACGSFYVQAFESPAERYSWLDEISDPQLVERLHGLSDADLELLTQIVIDGKSYREAAKVFSCSHQNISRHIARIRKNLS